MKKLILPFVMVFAAMTAIAQLTERPEMNLQGNYNIKMIASQTMQPAWISTVYPFSAINPITPVAPITNEEMTSAGQYLALNNRYDGSEIIRPVLLAQKPAAAKTVLPIYADCDDDYTTFQSSAAFFENDAEPKPVVRAYLYWTGHNISYNAPYAAYPGWSTLKSYSGTVTDAVTNKDKVKFKAPGMVNYINVTAQRMLSNATNESYTYFADVTQYVSGDRGWYWVANVCSGASKGVTGVAGGWTLLLVTESDTPRTIKFLESLNGSISVSGASSTHNFNLVSGDLPAEENAGYMGFIAIDGEDVHGAIADEMSANGTLTTEASRELALLNRLEIDGGTGVKLIQPFVEQKPVYACNSNGANCLPVYPGFVSSQISTYDNALNTNGNQMMRMPDYVNTLGYDSHLVRLPDNSIAPEATNVKVTFPSEQFGGYNIVMAYMVIGAKEDKEYNGEPQEPPVEPVEPIEPVVPIDAKEILLYSTDFTDWKMIDGSGADYDEVFDGKGGGEGFKLAGRPIVSPNGTIGKYTGYLTSDSANDIAMTTKPLNFVSGGIVEAWFYVANASTRTVSIEGGEVTQVMIKELDLDETNLIDYRRIGAGDTHMAVGDTGSNRNVLDPTKLNKWHDGVTANISSYGLIKVLFKMPELTGSHKITVKGMARNHLVAFKVYTSAEEIPEVVIEEGKEDAKITWTTIVNAVKYILTLHLDELRQYIFDTHYFDQDGKRQQVRSAAGIGASPLSFTIPNLTASTDYYYTLTAYDTDNQLLNASQGKFNTSGTTDLQETSSVSAKVKAYYSIMGIQLNAEPQTGIYIVVYDNGRVEKRVR